MKPPFAELFTMFHSASKTLKYPKIRFNLINGDRIQFYLATKGYIAIKHQSIYIGKIANPTAKVMTLYPAYMDLADELTAFALNPLESAIMKGQAYGHCCFCGLELTNKISVHHGYGPICADKYGLPWESESSSTNLIDL
jgi:hypothetical protein